MLRPFYGLDVIEHTLPLNVVAGETCGVRLTVRNTGRLTWRRQPEDGHCVHLFVLFGESLYQKVPLPHGDVPTGGEVTFHFAFRVATEGRHRVRLDLIHERKAWFSHHGCPSVDVAVCASPRSGDVTALAYDRSLARNLWHFQPTSGIRRFRDGSPVPIFVAKAKGCRVWDPEGHEYLDYTMGWGSTILGYADDRVQQAIAGYLTTSPLAPLPDPLEMEVSEMIATDFPSAAMVAFGKNGSDVCTLAARLARLYTGRSQILSCGFHGWQDFAVDPQGHLHKFPFNDATAFRALYERHRRDLAAIMIEPAGPFISPDEGLAGEPDAAFIALLAQAARDARALLIFDEIITGYRYREHSVQRALGVTPDLTCLGKALASGMPLAAVAGRGEIFHAGFARTHYCPTFKAEIYSLAAARAAIHVYRAEPVAAHIAGAGKRLIAAIDALCRTRGVNARCAGPPFRFTLVFRDPDPVRRRLLRTLYMQELLRERVLTVNGVMLPSYAHTDSDVDSTIDRMDVVLGRIASLDTPALNRALEIPLL